MLLKYKEISKKISTCFYKKQVFEEKILVCLCTEDAFCDRLQNPFFFP